MWIRALVRADTPQQVVAVVERRLQLGAGKPRHDSLRVNADGDRQLGGGIRVRVGDDQRAMTCIHRINWPVRVYLGIALVGHNLVVDVRGRRTPIPHRQY